MYENIKLSEIMTTNLVTVGPLDTMEKVEAIFEEHDFHHVPVVTKEGILLGIISKSDFLMMCDHMTIFRRSNSVPQNKRFFQSLLTQEVMVRQVARLHTHHTLKHAADLFKENLFHSIPVVEENTDKLLGIVTTLDLINYAFQEIPLTKSSS